MYEFIGKVFCYVGGFGLLLFVLYWIFGLALIFWKNGREAFSRVLKAESLIFTYRKHQVEIDKIIKEKGLK